MLAEVPRGREVGIVSGPPRAPEDGQSHAAKACQPGARRGAPSWPGKFASLPRQARVHPSPAKRWAGVAGLCRLREYPSDHLSWADATHHAVTRHNPDIGIRGLLGQRPAAVHGHGWQDHELPAWCLPGLRVAEGPRAHRPGALPAPLLDGDEGRLAAAKVPEDSPCEKPSSCRPDMPARISSRTSGLRSSIPRSPPSPGSSPG